MASRGRGRAGRRGRGARRRVMSRKRTSSRLRNRRGRSRPSRSRSRQRPASPRRRASRPRSMRTASRGRSSRRMGPRKATRGRAAKAIKTLKLNSHIKAIKDQNSKSHKIGAQALNMINTFLNSIMKSVILKVKENTEAIRKKKIISYIDVLVAASNVFGDDNKWIREIMERGEPRSLMYGPKLRFNEPRPRGPGSRRRRMTRGTRKVGADA